MTDKTQHTPEWAKDWEIVDFQIKEGVNPYAYRLGWLKGREPLAGIPNPAEWVEKQKQLDQWNLALIKSINEIRTENEQLKKEVEIFESSMKQLQSEEAKLHQMLDSMNIPTNGMDAAGNSGEGDREDLSLFQRVGYIVKRIEELERKQPK